MYHDLNVATAISAWHCRQRLCRIPSTHGMHVSCVCARAEILTSSSTSGPEELAYICKAVWTWSIRCHAPCNGHRLARIGISSEIGSIAVYGKWPIPTLLRNIIIGSRSSSTARKPSPSCTNLPPLRCIGATSNVMTAPPIEFFKRGGC